MQSPQNTGQEQPSQGYGQQPSYGQQPAYGQQGYGNSPLPSPMSSYEGSQIGGKRVLRSVSVGSAFKMGAILTALFYAVFGLFILMMGSMLSSLMPNGANLAAGGLVGYIMMIIFGGIAGGVGGAIYAALYNLVAGWVGGIEVEVA